MRLHIESAVAHLGRGQGGDSSAFTDAIYRCNQAFEGSVKEAYRVLAKKDPDRITPAKIENFLTEENVLRERVLEQFTNYRTKWRNPSTHDYTLDFDENEALLAIVSVTVFASVLTDQIRSRLAAETAEKAIPHSTERLPKSVPLIDEVERRIVEFAEAFETVSTVSEPASPSEYEGALLGYLTAQFAATPGIRVEGGFRHEGREADLAIARGNELIAVEIKRMQRPQESRVVSGLAYLSDLLGRGFTDGVLLATVVGDRSVLSSQTWETSGQKVRAVLSHSLTRPLIDGRFD